MYPVLEGMGGVGGNSILQYQYSEDLGMFKDSLKIACLRLFYPIRIKVVTPFTYMSYHEEN